MRQKKEVGEGDSVSNKVMETPSGKGGNTVTVTGTETPAVGTSKGKKLGIKRVKKKPDMNISTGKLKSLNTPKNFSFLNMSVQKQTLRANNRALAQNLAKARQDIRHLNTEIQALRSQYQEQCVELNRLKRLVGLKDEEIQQEVQKRIQDEMQGMRHLLEELTQSMMLSSTYVNKMNDKCLAYCSRRSTDSSRSVSLGSSQGNQSLNRLSSRSAFGSKDELMAKYLSKADEFTAPPGSRIFSDNNNAADMSIIAEQSILDNNEEIFTAHPLTSVEETLSEISPAEGASVTKPMSKLPQRVLKYSDSSKLSTAVTSELSTIDTKNEKCGKEVVKSRSKGSRSNDTQSEKNKVSDKVNSSSNLNSKPSVDDKVKVVKNKADQTVKDNKNEGKEIEHDADISAFGFGGSFAADLVSGSPISAEKRRETFVMTKQAEGVENKSKETDKRRETFVKPKDVEASVNKTSGKEEHKKRETFVMPKAPLQNNTKGAKEVKRINDVKANSSKTTSVKKKENGEKFSLKTKEKRRETYETDNPFVPKTARVQRSPERQVTEEETVYDSVADPFKPTKTLIRSPVHVSVQSASPEKKIDSLAFLAKFRQSLESKPVESSPLPEPEIPDEPTTYFNSEMEFTSVIDSTKLLQSFSKSQKNSPVYQTIDGIEADNTTDSNKHPKPSETGRSKKSCNAADKLETQQGVNEAAAVEVRTKKPGVFTFSVARKEADGTRKPVPDKVSKARSKKKRQVTPEKEECNTGPDRDMFNFGDRTPTMPLEKLAKAKSVYDLSMNESMAAPLVSLKNFSNKESQKVPEAKKQDDVYYVPLKDSSDEKPVSKSSRSQSRSRSKSRKTYEEDDEDWVPGGKSRARSKSRGRKSDDEKTTQRRGRSQSRKRVVNESEGEETDTSSQEKSRSGSEQVEKEEIVERRGRSQSRRRVVNESKMEETEKLRARFSSGSNKAEKEEITVRRGRSRSRARVIKDEENTENNDDEMESDLHDEIEAVDKKTKDEKSSHRLCRSKTRKDREVLQDGILDTCEEVNRRGRSKSKARSKEAEDIDKAGDEPDCNSNSETSPVPRRSTRSKSLVRKAIVNDDDSDEFENSPQIQRKSRSVHKRKTFEVKDNENDSEKVETETVDESKAKKQFKATEPRTQKSPKVKPPALVVPDSSDESESKEMDESNMPKMFPNNEIITKDSGREIVVEESDSDSENLKAIERSRRKSRRRAKSTRYDESDFEDDIEFEKNVKKPKKSVAGEANIEGKRGSSISVEDNGEGRNFAFINKRRGKSIKIPNDDEVDDLDEVCVTKDESSNVDSKKDHLKVVDNLDERLSESPKLSKKNEDRKASKSVKKSTKKRKQEDTESVTGKSKKNITEKLNTEGPVENDEISKSSVTPAVVPSVSKKSGKTSRTGKSTKKVKAEPLPDQTPVNKEEKMTSQVEDKPSALALLKKRLTMVGTKHAVHEDRTEVDHKSRKRSKDELDDLQVEESETPDNKRTRRNRNPVSYVPKPLNVKLRQGDQMFQDVPMSKVKAEQTRLAIAKKTTVPKISRDDKENVQQT